jgi:hypothetical protein
MKFNISNGNLPTIERDTFRDSNIITRQSLDYNSVVINSSNDAIPYVNQVAHMEVK